LHKELRDYGSQLVDDFHSSVIEVHDYFLMRRAPLPQPDDECKCSKKNFVSMMVALGLAVAFTGTAFAATKAPHTQATCEKAHMMWDAATKKCTKGSM
jgi:hypothetical protein